MLTLHNSNWFRHAFNHGLLGLVLLQVIIIPAFIFKINIPGLFVDFFEVLSLSLINYLNFRNFRLHYGLAKDFRKILSLSIVCSVTAYTGLNLEILFINMLDSIGLRSVNDIFILFLGIPLAAAFGLLASLLLYAINPGAKEAD